MKNRFIKYITIFIFFISFSCVDNESELLFDDVPSERINSKLEEVKQLLINSEHGWKITYFTDDSILGGYSYVFRFKEDGTVEMDSDFGVTKGTVTSSLWTVDFGATVKLNFTTQNKIHELSDSNNSPDPELRGQGYRGSFEFLFYGTEGENLSFQAARDNTPVLFEKATQKDWDDLSKNDDIINLINGQLSYVKDDATQTFDYNGDRRFATNSNNQITNTNFGIGFTSNGIKVSPSIIDDNGVSHDTFTLNDSRSAFVSTKGNFSIFILNLPFNINQGWQIEIEENEVSPLVLSTFNAVSEENSQIYDNPQETLLETVFFGDVSFGGPPVLGILFVSVVDGTEQNFAAQYRLSFQGVNSNENLIDISKENGEFNWSFYTHLEPFIDLIANNAPYDTELNMPENPTEVRLTSTSNPDVWFTIRLNN